MVASAATEASALAAAEAVLPAKVVLAELD